MNTKSATILAIAAAVAIAATPAAAALPHLAWLTETADGASVNPFSRTSAAFDTEGVLHLAYAADGPSGPSAVWLGTHAGESWGRSVVDEGAHSPDLAFDASGDLQMVYRGSGLQYAVRDANGSWSHDTVDSAHGPARLALDSQGHPHIAYSTAGGLQYAVPSSHGWTTHTVDSASNAGYWLGLSIDSGGDPHIAYFAPGSPGGDLRYAVKTAGEWNVTTLRQGCGEDVSLALDAQDQPHIACHGVDEGLAYIHKTSAGWTEEVADDGSLEMRPASAVGYDSSLALDAQGEPHIAYRYKYGSWRDNPTEPGRLHYATKLNNTWVTETVDRDGQLNGIGASLALDADDRPHISYVYGWRSYSQSCSHPLNECFDLRYATPAAALGAGSE